MCLVADGGGGKVVFLRCDCVAIYFCAPCVIDGLDICGIGMRDSRWNIFEGWVLSGDLYCLIFSFW